MPETGSMSVHAFETFYEEHARGLVRFLLYRTGDVALAEDLTADTFERVIRTRRPFDARLGSQKTWLYSIALNVLRDHLRRRGAEERAMGRAGAPDASDHSDAEGYIGLRDEISRALRTLNEDEREVIALRYGADLTVPQIATATATKAATIEKRLYRALGKLREEMSEGREDGIAASAEMSEQSVRGRFPRRARPWKYSAL